MPLWKIYVASNNKMYSGLHVKWVPYIFVVLQPNLQFLDRFSWKFPISCFAVICPVGAMLIYADRWTDMMKLTAAFATKWMHLMIFSDFHRQCLVHRVKVVCRIVQNSHTFKHSCWILPKFKKYIRIATMLCLRSLCTFCREQNITRQAMYS